MATEGTAMGDGQLRFQGRTAVVTGAASGLGQAVAIRLGAEGAAVACLDVASSGAQETAAAIGAAGGTARAYQVDVSAPDAVRTTVAAGIKDLGRPSVLINCAGVGKFANTHEMPFADWSRIIGVNLTGTFLMAQAVLPALLDGGGNIVNIASSAGLMGVAYSAAYGASKGGVIQFTRALADEYLGRGVRVNAVAPGAMDTPIQASFMELPDGADLTKLNKLLSPVGFATPEEVAALVAFVASDDGRYMTGSILTIDGGLTI